MFLPDVAHVRGPFEDDAISSDAGIFEGLAAFGLELFKLGLEVVHLEIIQAREQCLHIVAPQVGHEHAERGNVSRRVRNNDLADGKLFPYCSGVELSATATGGQGKIAIIAPTLERQTT